MKLSTTILLRSKGMALAVHVAFWMLLALIMVNLKDTPLPYRVTSFYSLPAASHVPVARLGSLFVPKDWPAVVLNTNSPSPFFTAAFVPPPKPPPPPPPPAPTTAKVALTYQGYYESAGGPRYALIKSATTFQKAPVGGQVLTNHFVSDITMHGLTVTNTAGQTNLLLLNIPKELEIPIK